MVDISPKQCYEFGCFGKAEWGQDTPQFCVNHKKENMNFISKISCLVEGCTQTPKYGEIRDDRAYYCAKHKGKTMVRKVCLGMGCFSKPMWGDYGNPKYCIHHRPKGVSMASSRRCVCPECRRVANYNFFGLNVMYCSLHKQPGMISCPTAKCKHSWCYNDATHGKKPKVPITFKNYALHCHIHSQPGEILINIK